MRVFADLHIHSPYSQASSNDLSVANLEKYGRMKGISLLGSGDLTHPTWLAELKQGLTDDGSGILETKSGYHVVLSGEISLIYSQGGRGRRIHLCLLAPSFDVAERIQKMLLRFGRLDYDGRPIFGVSCPAMVEALRAVDERIEVIPAHIWTPWFSLFGSKSGFDSVEECFQDQAKHIHCLETGLSSDPAMNWRLSSLDRYTLVSNSDSHSYWPWRIGREGNLLDLKEWSYDTLIHTLRTRKGFLETIEFWPHEGKYHFDGHRACGVCFSPEESRRHRNLCPKCGQPLTIGVANRVAELADRPEGFRPEHAVPFRNLIPLHELIGGALRSGVASKKVWQAYSKLIAGFGDEMAVLLDAPEQELARHADAAIVKLILANRDQRIPFSPGYDGEYGRPDFSQWLGAEGGMVKKTKGQEKERKRPLPSQKGLADYF